MTIVQVAYYNEQVFIKNKSAHFFTPHQTNIPIFSNQQFNTKA